MKKVLVLLLVLGLASVANATLQISVNGEPAPPDSQIVLEPSETLALDIYTDALIPNFTGFTWGLAVMSADASLSWDQAIVHPITGTNQINGPWPMVGPPPPPAGEAGLWGSIFAVGADVQAGTTFVDNIIFHCEWQPNEVFVHLYTIAESGEITLVDTVNVHQIPEPMTVGLLGLGGLFLLRRRK